MGLRQPQARHQLVTYIPPCDNVTGHAKYPSRQCDWSPGFLSELIVAGRPCGPIYFQQRCWINNHILFTPYRLQPFVDGMLDSLPGELLRMYVKAVRTGLISPQVQNKGHLLALSRVSRKLRSIIFPHLFEVLNVKSYNKTAQGGKRHGAWSNRGILMKTSWFTRIWTCLPVRSVHCSTGRRRVSWYLIVHIQKSKRI